MKELDIKTILLELLRDYKSRKFVLVLGFGVFVYVTCKDEILVSPIALYLIAGMVALYVLVEGIADIRDRSTK